QCVTLPAKIRSLASPANVRFCRRRDTRESRSLQTIACCEWSCSRGTAHYGPRPPFHSVRSQRSQFFYKRAQPCVHCLPPRGRKQPFPVPDKLERFSDLKGICFTNERSFRQPRIVRTWFAVWALLTTALCWVRAQD